VVLGDGLEPSHTFLHQTNLQVQRPFMRRPVDRYWNSSLRSSPYLRQDGSDAVEDHQCAVGIDPVI